MIKPKSIAIAGQQILWSSFDTNLEGSRTVLHIMEIHRRRRALSVPFRYFWSMDPPLYIYGSGCYEGMTEMKRRFFSATVFR